MKSISLLLSLFLLVACSTISEEPERPVRPSKKRPSFKPPLQKVPPLEQVDLNQLRKQLRMDRNHRDLGARTKSFNTCNVQAGFSPAHCRKLYMSVVHFRVRCRATTGTVESVTRLELKALKNQPLTWMLAGQMGRTTTDYEGYGQVYILTAKKPYSERFILRSKTQNLGLRLNSVSQIMVPRDWCYN